MQLHLLSEWHTPTWSPLHSWHIEAAQKVQMHTSSIHTHWCYLKVPSKFFTVSTELCKALELSPHLQGDFLEWNSAEDHSAVIPHGPGYEATHGHNTYSVNPWAYTYLKECTALSYDFDTYHHRRSRCSFCFQIKHTNHGGRGHC